MHNSVFISLLVTRYTLTCYVLSDSIKIRRTVLFSTKTCCYTFSRKSNNEKVDEFSYIYEDDLSSLPRHGNILDKELYQLRVIISKIRSAHNGISEEEVARNGVYLFYSVFHGNLYSAVR